MPKVPVLALQFDFTFGFPVLTGYRIEWRDSTWIDAALVICAAVTIAL